MDLNFGEGPLDLKRHACIAPAAGAQSGERVDHAATAVHELIDVGSERVDDRYVFARPGEVQSFFARRNEISSKLDGAARAMRRRTAATRSDR